ncbi:MAG: carboxylesterase/lipase family protein [Candidatus Obscuribacterales bacterium]|nr:carboxylesterase/lipase family protein [Steroidobacteraceae bacterium]
MKNNVFLSRRALLKSGTLAIAGTAAGFAGVANAITEAEMFPTVETQYGKVRGVEWQGIKTFKGVRYGASTAGKNRFMPPKPPAPWTGVFDAFDYGQIAPQAPTDRRSHYSGLILWDRQPGGIGEDCLVLNVWTPSINDNAKRAVLVVFHGGGFASGSGNSIGFDGDQAARYDDVVVVSVNHRLAAFGFLHLADLGAPTEFKYAGVTGALDMVAALKWVNENIERFGGDAKRVMIFGQSGGGAKTSTVLAMPSAKGLFHRAGVQSGSSLRLATPEAATKSAEKLLQTLNIPKNRIADLQKIPFTQLLAAQVTSSAGFSPVVGSDALPHHPFDPIAPPESADVPIIIGTTLDDAALSLTNFTLDEAGLKAQIQKQLGANADRVYKLYRDTYPKTSPYLIQARIATDRGFRRSAFKQAELKAAQGTAPVYLYTWEWPVPAFDGKFGAVHGVDVGAAVHDFRGAINGSGSKEGTLMVERFAAVWAAFAKTGVPNSSLTPAWNAFDEKQRATMVFDVNTRVVNDHRREFRLLWDEIIASTPSA